MKIRITGRGIYGKDGRAVKPGTVLDLGKAEPPQGWKGKYVPEVKDSEEDLTSDKGGSKTSGHPKAPVGPQKK